MDWKDVLSRPPEAYDESKLEELFSEIILLEKSDKFDSKQYKKMFRLCLAILKFKGSQINLLHTEIKDLTNKQVQQQSSDPSRMQELEGELQKFKAIIDKLELDKAHYKNKCREHVHEIGVLQKRLHEVNPDNDSGDALSEIDRQQELLNNISMKNKHIKRLIRDIEDMEAQNLSNMKLINDLKNTQQDTNLSLATLSQQFHESQVVINQQSDTIRNQILEIDSLKVKLSKVINEKIELNKEIDVFGRELEERAKLWKSVIDSKDVEINQLKQKYEDLVTKHPGYDIDLERNEHERFFEAIRDKDRQIQEMEQLINRQNEEFAQLEREYKQLKDHCGVLEQKKETMGQCSFCEEAKINLERSNARCLEMQQILSNVEDDNLLKSKQAYEAFETLRKYETGKYGLPEALTELDSLRAKLHSRDKKIKELVSEVNSMNDLAIENAVLRKRLGISDNDEVSTKNFVAKYRKLEKINDKLSLKLQAYEEINLQLKLERNDLRRQLMGTTHKNSKRRKNDPESSKENALDDEHSLESFQGEQFRVCEHCFKQYEYIEPWRNCTTCSQKHGMKYCEPCQDKLNLTIVDKRDLEVQKLSGDYEKVVEENENLRIGMHEILDQLREYDAISSHITIESSTLERLLHALDSRSISGWYHPAMRMQNELLAVKEREMALLSRVRSNEELISLKAAELAKATAVQVEPVNPTTTADAITAPLSTEDQQKLYQLENELKSKAVEIEKYRQMVEADDENQIEILKENDRLKTIERLYHQLQSTLQKSDSEKDRLIVTTLTDLNEFETKFSMMSRKLRFLKEENLNLLNTLKTMKLDTIKVAHELKAELIVKEQEMKTMKDSLNDLNELRETRQCNSELKTEINRLKLELSSTCTRLLKNIKHFDADDIEFDTSKLENVAIVKENLAVEFISAAEFQQLKQKDAAKNQTERNLRAEIEQLEKVMVVLNEQLQAQQRLITTQSDEEISLRHLVADLQSASDDKYLLSRTRRELDEARALESELKLTVEHLQQKLENQERENEKSLARQQEKETNISKELKNYSLKMKYLQKSLLELKDSYMLYTPLYLIIDFLKLYADTKDLKAELNERAKDKNRGDNKALMKQMKDVMMDTINDQNDNQLKLKYLESQLQNERLLQQLNVAENKLKLLQTEIDSINIKNLENNQHWNIITMLFDNKNKDVSKHASKGTQTSSEKVSRETITDESLAAPDKKDHPKRIEKSTSIHKTSHVESDAFVEALSTQNSLKVQLKQALSLASSRNVLLLETETRLAEARGRIQCLERSIIDRDAEIKAVKNSDKAINERKEDSILSITITSLQNLLIEKDTTLSKYQDLLRAERQSRSKEIEVQTKEIKRLKIEIDNLEDQIRKKEKEVESVKEQSSATTSAPKQSSTNIPLKKKSSSESADESTSSEDKIKFSPHIWSSSDKHKKMGELEAAVERMERQVLEMSDREKIWEKNLVDLENENAKLKQQLQSTSVAVDEVNENINNRREIDRLQKLVEEKDCHIQDLTETLTNFHDDQRNFMADTDLQSTEQVTQLSVDLTRFEATNKVLKTQLDAVKRQLSNVTLRESQARELIRNLKSQLIRRPVISVKTERLMSSREEQLRKRNQQLETEIESLKDELKRQMTWNENRRAKSASDLGLWEKQKRWQETAEKLRDQLKIKEVEIERLQATLQSAKTSVIRLEREKHILEQRKATSNYCTSASCPNLHLVKATSESPESYVQSSTTPDCAGGVAAVNVLNESNRELVEALKSRVEAQQRRIAALELEGRGQNAMLSEIDKLTNSTLELQSQNVRLEARVLQLQLENTKLSEKPDSALMQNQIAHLEDYIKTVKSELYRTKSALSTTNDRLQTEVENTDQLKKTISTLRAMIDKLKIENKSLREYKPGKVINPPTSSIEPSKLDDRVSKETYESLKQELDKMQKMYSDVTEKLASLQVDLQLQTSVCSQCKQQRHSSGGSSGSEIDDTGEAVESQLETVKAKLMEKTKLLEKAKILLTRAAAKEKNLREQITYLRRRCSELQNVPVIEETSE